MSRQTMNLSIRVHRLFQMAMAVILLSLSMPKALAYMHGGVKLRTRGIQSTSALSAWSIPAPPAFSTPSLGASWYNKVDPTARGRAIYNDDGPLDYTFSVPGNDWPSSFDAVLPQSSLASQPKTRINPLRRATKWLRKNQSQ